MEARLAWRANRSRAKPVPRQEDSTHALEARADQSRFWVQYPRLPQGVSLGQDKDSFNPGGCPRHAREPRSAVPPPLTPPHLLFLLTLF